MWINIPSKVESLFTWKKERWPLRNDQGTKWPYTPHGLNSLTILFQVMYHIRLGPKFGLIMWIAKLNLKSQPPTFYICSSSVNVRLGVQGWTTLYLSESSNRAKVGGWGGFNPTSQPSIWGRAREATAN